MSFGCDFDMEKYEYICDYIQNKLASNYLYILYCYPGRKSVGSDKMSVVSEISTGKNSIKSFWSTRKPSVLPQNEATTNGIHMSLYTTDSNDNNINNINNNKTPINSPVPQLLRRTARISISHDEGGLRPGYCDSPGILLPDKDSELNGSINSIMIVLMPPASGMFSATLQYILLFLNPDTFEIKIRPLFFS